MKWGQAIESLKAGGAGVIPTDTLYGLVASALKPDAVERVYAIKGRDEGKPPILLISSLDDLRIFGVQFEQKASDFINKNWPAQLSIILGVEGESHSYLHRGTNSLAFRLPDNQELQKFLSKTGPLIAPSANPQGEKPASTIAEAEAYFGDSVDFYVDGGTLESLPSTLVDLRDGAVKILRQGAYHINIDSESQK